MMWQAETNYGFSMTGGYVRPKPPPRYEGSPAVATIDENDPRPHGLADVRAFAHATGLTVIVVDDALRDHWASLLAALQHAVAGVHIYRRAGKVPATCA